MTAENPSPPVQIILTPPRRDLITRILRRYSACPDLVWIYLGDNAAESIRLETQLGRSVPRVSIAGMLQEAAQRYRQQYIDYIGTITRSHCSIPWFLTSFSEKNPFASSFYFSFCAMAACMEYLATAGGTVLVVCGSPGIKGALDENLRARGYSVDSVPSGTFRSLTGACGAWMLGAGRRWWFALRYGFRILLARIFHLSVSGGDTGSPAVLIHAWADQRSFHDDGTFRDIFSGDLVPVLSRDARVSYLIDVLPTMPYLRALLSLRGVPKPGFLLQECLLSPADILRALGEGHRALQAVGTVHPLADLEIGPLVEEEQKRDALHVRGPQSYLYFCAGRRIAARYPSASYFYTFENHMWEKCFISGIRELSRDARIIGYAHSLVYPLNLSYSLSRSESGCTPLPDLILTNGTKPRDMLIRSGFPESSVHVSGALRYAALRQLRGVPEEKPGDAVLVAGSVSRERTVELIHKVLQALGGSSEVPVWIKCHPNLPFTRLEQMLPPLPPNFSVREEPVEALFPSTSLVLFTESTVAVEAAARGIPVIHVRLDCSLDMNIFEGLPLISSLGTPEEIRQVALSLRGRTPGDLPRIQEFIGTLFGGVDPDRIRALVLPVQSPLHR